MESAGFRHSRSPSSDRFLGIFSLSPPDSVTASTPGDGGTELIEEDVFWTTDFAEPSQDHHHRHRTSFLKSQNSGILAVLPEIDLDSQVLRRKASISPSSRPIPAFPRRLCKNQGSQDRDYSQSVPTSNLFQSAPMNIPVPARAIGRRGNSKIFDEEEEEEEDKILPPHEIVGRGSGVSPSTTFSVLEGVGRTLKGRDLRQVRNAIWRKTGFLD